MSRTPIIFLLVVILSCNTLPLSASSAAPDVFLSCLAVDIPHRLVHTPASSSYAEHLFSSIRNLRFVAPDTPRPLAIVAAAEPKHVQATVRCGRRHGVRVRTRSGGHDYEGISYTSLDHHERFAVLDLAAFRSIRVDAPRAEAWAGSGATLGELYFAIGAANRTLAFPAGSCPTVCLGGHLSGGGFGALARKYGLSADNVVDAVVVDADGRLQNRSTMGEDYFWAIRGGGGESFGVVLAWKLHLVRVPETVTLFSIRRSRNQSAIDLITRWQEISPVLPWDLYLRVVVDKQQAYFVALFLGSCGRLHRLIRTRFPDLGMTQQDCEEVSWVQSTVFFAFDSTAMPLEVLLQRGNKRQSYVKAKSDHVQVPMPRQVWESTWARLERPEAASLMLEPYGGFMGSISSSVTPFPHRKGNLYQLQYYSEWFENGSATLKKRMKWVRDLYKELEPYVSKNPRAVYVNYRDLDLGTNKLEGNVTSYANARAWGEKYFKGNFERLAAVKAMVDPEDFFRNEQSIPPLPTATLWSPI
ncbi:hypothetical protein SEVIR_6G105900v4 [Setaria viridis]|nr:berberine bridge enzyme-like 18 [Setaria viridis]